MHIDYIASIYIVDKKIINKFCYKIWWYLLHLQHSTKYKEYDISKIEGVEQTPFL